NKEIFAMYGLQDFVAETAEDVCSVLDKLLNNKIVFEPQLSKVVDAVEKHFDKLYSLIISNNLPSADYGSFIKPLIDTMPQLVNLESSNNYLKTAEKEKINLINELNQTISERDNAIRELNHSYALAVNSVHEMQSSFFWRITAVPRKFAQKLKDFLAKHPAILEIFIFTKGFLRGGIKSGKQKVMAYRKLTWRTNRFSHKISAKTRKTESSFKFDKDIKFSILVPLYNTPKNFLKEMIDSVRNQTYSNWELCLADGSDDKHSYVGKYCQQLARRDKRIVYKKLTENKGISENTNECIKMSSGNYIALFDHDDVLHPSVLFECMKAICEKDAEYVYTDEAVFLGTDITNITTYHFKPDFAYDNLLANNYICHFSTFKASLIDKVGMFRHSYDGSQDHDIILRLTSVAKNITHIPKILYFWRSHANSVAMDINSKAYAIKAGITAVHDFLADKGIETHVESSPAFPAIYRIKYPIKNNPKVSIIIPNKDNVTALDKCLKSINAKTSYNNYEIIIVDNQSAESRTADYYQRLGGNVKLLSYDKPYNYSAIANYAAANADGEYFLFLDSDTEIITPDWIEELLMYAQRDDIGAVGAKLLLPDNSLQNGGIILGDGKNEIVLGSHAGLGRDDLGYMGKMFYAQNVSAVATACLMVKKSDFIAVGGFDAKQSMAYCDVDFCLALRDNGKSNIFNPFCMIYHWQNKSFFDEETFNTETEQFKLKWKDVLEKGDPYYNPNFSTTSSYQIDF
ncbi:MAG: glycosyltransferase, partial [Clostridia bacterium]|nr:glycosyltransferase [Clostridia bacterium]